MVQSRKPSKIGIAAARSVYFTLPVSFLMVRRVVEQGAWKRKSRMKQAAVVAVHPFARKISRIAFRFCTSRRLPSER